MFYQGLQTLENNKKHSAYRLVIFNVLSRLQNIREQQKSLGLRLVIFIILSCFTNTREQSKSLGSMPHDFHCSLVFVTRGKTLELVYEILLINRQHWNITTSDHWKSSSGESLELIQQHHKRPFLWQPTRTDEGRPPSKAEASRRLQPFNKTFTGNLS